MKRKYLVTAVTVILLAAIALPVGAQTIWQTYGNVRAKQLNVLGATDLDGALNVDGATGQILSSDIALGQWDTATLVYYGVSWVQLAESDN